MCGGLLGGQGVLGESMEDIRGVWLGVVSKTVYMTNGCGKFGLFSLLC